MQDVCAYTVNSREAEEAGRFLGIQGQLGLYNDFQRAGLHILRLCCYMYIWLMTTVNNKH